MFEDLGVLVIWVCEPHGPFLMQGSVRAKQYNGGCKSGRCMDIQSFVFRSSTHDWRHFGICQI